MKVVVDRKLKKNYNKNNYLHINKIDFIILFCLVWKNIELLRKSYKWQINTSDCIKLD